MSDRTEFPKATDRIDPYRNFKFRIRWGSTYVAGVSEVSGLARTTEVIRHREGGDPGVQRRMPGQQAFGPVVLERGVSYDVAFEQWCNKVWDYPNSSALGQEVSLKDFRKDLTVELYNLAGQRVLAYNLYRCWPSEYTPLSELDGDAIAVPIQSLTLENEGWERDTSVQELTEPSFTLPRS